MTLPTSIQISFAIEGALLAFHLSLLAVIARNVARNVPTFSTAFYKICLAQSVLDYFVYGNICFIRFTVFDVIPATSYDNQIVGIIEYFVSGKDIAGMSDSNPSTPKDGPNGSESSDWRSGAGFEWGFISPDIQGPFRSLH